MKFHLEIIDQGWVSGSNAEYDLCSHGRILLVIGGVNILNGGNEYGIVESALALLRTIRLDHSKGNPVADRLIQHGCGTILMIGCAIGVDWKVDHNRMTVRISDVRKFETTDEKETNKYPGIDVIIPVDIYRKQIINFAARAKELYANTRKIIEDEQDQADYNKFWTEFNNLIEEGGR